jgi:hypothetical protein
VATYQSIDLNLTKWRYQSQNFFSLSVKPALLLHFLRINMVAVIDEKAAAIMIA